VYHAREIATGIEIAIKKLTVVQEADLRDTIKEIEIMKQVSCKTSLHQRRSERCCDFVFVFFLSLD
jgi:hypothetical protein